MKLAEALQERADLNRKIEELRRRLGNCVLVQEGEEPAEDPAALLRELDGAVARLAVLMAAINLTNSKTKVNGETLTELIVCGCWTTPCRRPTGRRSCWKSNAKIAGSPPGVHIRRRPPKP